MHDHYEYTFTFVTAILSHKHTLVCSWAFHLSFGSKIDDECSTGYYIHLSTPHHWNPFQCFPLRTLISSPCWHSGWADSMNCPWKSTQGRCDISVWSTTRASSHGFWEVHVIVLQSFHHPVSCVLQQFDYLLLSLWMVVHSLVCAWWFLCSHIASKTQQHLACSHSNLLFSAAWLWLELCASLGGGGIKFFL